MRIPFIFQSCAQSLALTVDLSKTFRFLVKPRRQEVYQMHTEHHSCRLMVKSSCGDSDDDDRQRTTNKKEVDVVDELDPFFTGNLIQSADPVVIAGNRSPNLNRKSSGSQVNRPVSSQNELILSDRTTMNVDQVMFSVK